MTNRGTYPGATPLVTPPAHVHRYVPSRITVPTRNNPARGLFGGFLPNPNFSEWQPWYPVVSQPGAIAATVNYARYLQQGKQITAVFDLGVTGAGTVTNNVTVSLPFQPFTQPAAASLHIGFMMIYKLSTTTRYNGNAELIGNTGTVGLSYSQASASLWGVSPNLALASGDIIRATISYEAM